jgi:hypothetical protein
LLILFACCVPAVQRRSRGEERLASEEMYPWLPAGSLGGISGQQQRRVEFPLTSPRSRGVSCASEACAESVQFFSPPTLHGRAQQWLTRASSSSKATGGLRRSQTAPAVSSSGLAAASCRSRRLSGNVSRWLSRLQRSASSSCSSSNSSQPCKLARSRGLHDALSFGAMQCEEDTQLHTGTTSHTHHPSESEFDDYLHSVWLNPALATTVASAAAAAPVLDTYLEDSSPESADSSSSSSSSDSNNAAAAIAVAAAQHELCLTLAEESLGARDSRSSSSISTSSSRTCGPEKASTSARVRSYSI